MKKYISLVLALVLIPWTAFATTGSSQDVVTELQTLLVRIQRIEAENALYKTILSRHDIQIPLEEYNRALSGVTLPPPAPIITS